MEYLDFDVSIDVDGDRYRAAIDDDGTVVTHEFEWPFSNDQLERHLGEIGRPRMRASRRRLSGQRFASSDPAMEERRSAKQFGIALGGAVLAGDIAERLGLARARAGKLGRGLRLRLRLADDVRLQATPWEFLWDDVLGGHPVLSQRTPVVRYLHRDADDMSSLKVDLPLKILLMVASPEDSRLATLDVAREQNLMRLAMRPLEKKNLVDIEVMDRADLDSLQNLLRQDEFHVFHYIGHGDFDETTRSGTLALEDSTGSLTPATGDQLMVHLRDHESLRLVVLNACDGARSAGADPFSGVATSLVWGGLPAVIAMQFEISDEAAIIFAREFYESLADGYVVDQALAEARKSIYGRNDLGTEWGTPVLFMRTPDGRLFDIKGREATEVPIAPGDGEAGEYDAPQEPGPAPTSIVSVAGRFTQWASGVGHDHGSHGTLVAGALFAVSAIVVVAALWLGVGFNFDGPTGPNEPELSSYRGLLVTWNWPLILLLAPIAAWLTISFLISLDQAVGRADRWVASREPDGPTLSAVFARKFRWFWLVWRLAAPIIVTAVVLATEYHDWVSPFADGAVWADRDWSVATRVDDPSSPIVLLIFNSAVFGVEIALVTCALFTLGTALFVAATVGGAWNERHWLPRTFGLRPGSRPTIRDLKVPIYFLLAFFVLALIVAIAATIENAYYSASGIDPGIVALALAAIAVPIMTVVMLTVLWIFRARLELESDQLRPDRPMTWLTAVVTVLAVANLLILLTA